MGEDTEEDRQIKGIHEEGGTVRWRRGQQGGHGGTEKRGGRKGLVGGLGGLKVPAPHTVFLGSQ